MYILSQSQSQLQLCCWPFFGFSNPNRVLRVRWLAGWSSLSCRIGSGVVSEPSVSTLRSVGSGAQRNSITTHAKRGASPCPALENNPLCPCCPPLAPCPSAAAAVLNVDDSAVKSRSSYPSLSPAPAFRNQIFASPISASSHTPISFTCPSSPSRNSALERRSFSRMKSSDDDDDDDDGICASVLCQRRKMRKYSPLMCWKEAEMGYCPYGRMQWRIGWGCEDVWEGVVPFSVRVREG